MRLTAENMTYKAYIDTIKAKTGKDPEGKTRRKDRAKRPSGCQGFTN